VERAAAAPLRWRRAARVGAVVALPVVVVPAAVVPAGALVALPAGRVAAAADPAAVVGALVAAPLAAVAAVVAAGFGVSVALLPPQAARIIGRTKTSNPKDVRRAQRPLACVCPVPTGSSFSLRPPRVMPTTTTPGPAYCGVFRARIIGRLSSAKQRA
jgi:hypothetical protein